MNEDDPVRTVLERIPYGICVVATNRADNRPIGIVATWMMQVSFEPPLIAVSVEKAGVLAGALSLSGRFSLNLVSNEGIHLAKGILKSGPLLDGADIREAFVSSPGAPPVMKDSSGVLVCEITQTHEAGDHLVIIAEVVHGVAPDSSDVLTLRETGWKYRRKHPTKGSS